MKTNHVEIIVLLIAFYFSFVNFFGGHKSLLDLGHGTGGTHGGRPETTCPENSP